MSAHHICMANLALEIQNMHCGACVRRVTQTLNALPSTHADEVKIGAARVTTEAPAGEIVQALEAAGYPATLAPTQP